jgi:hypothetical protein
MTDDLKQCASQLEQLTRGLDPTTRRKLLAALPAIADKIAQTAQVIGPDPVRPKSKSDDSNRSTVACPHCGNMVSVTLATK